MYTINMYKKKKIVTDAHNNVTGKMCVHIHTHTHKMSSVLFEQLNLRTSKTGSISTSDDNEKKYFSKRYLTIHQNPTVKVVRTIFENNKFAYRNRRVLTEQWKFPSSYANVV